MTTTADNAKNQESGHALLSPSSADRWLHCTPSAVAESAYPDESSSFATEGSLAHAYCAGLITEALGRDTKAFRKEIEELEPQYIGDMGEMITCARNYADFVEDLYMDLRKRDPRTEIHIETKLDLSGWAPGSFGTSDAVVIGAGELHVIDFKYGKGVQVSAKGNPQMRLYALGALDEFGVERRIGKVVTHIYQPRLDNYGSEELTVEELYDWGEDCLEPLARVAAQGLGVRDAGSWCRFCKAAGGCEALDRNAALAMAIDVKSQTPEQIGKTCLPLVDTLRLWIDTVQERALALMIDGQEVPGYKVVEGRSNRVISDPEGLRKALEEAGYEADEIMKPAEMQTLTVLEKVVGKKKFKELGGSYITKPRGKPAIATADDKRKAWTAAGVFAAVDTAADGDE